MTNSLSSQRRERNAFFRDVVKRWRSLRNYLSVAILIYFYGERKKRSRRRVRLPPVRFAYIFSDKISKIGERSNSPLVREIIDLIELFKDYVITRMRKVPEVDRVHATDLHDSRIKIAEARSEYEALQIASEEESSNFEILLKDIVTCLTDEEKLIRNIRETSEAEISREIRESMSEMLIAKEQGKTRKRQLESEISVAEQRLLSVREFNAVIEKKLFDECAKVEQEYTDLLARYDRDIGASHALMEKLLRDNEIVKSKTRDVEDQLIKQRALLAEFGSTSSWRECERSS